MALAHSRSECNFLNSNSLGKRKLFSSTPNLLNYDMEDGLAQNRDGGRPCKKGNHVGLNPVMNELAQVFQVAQQVSNQAQLLLELNERLSGMSLDTKQAKPSTCQSILQAISQSSAATSMQTDSEVVDVATLRFQQAVAQFQSCRTQSEVNLFEEALPRFASPAPERNYSHSRSPSPRASPKKVNLSPLMIVKPRGVAFWVGLDDLPSPAEPENVAGQLMDLAA